MVHHALSYDVRFTVLQLTIDKLHLLRAGGRRLLDDEIFEEQNGGADDRYQKPRIAMVLNVARGRGSQPALLSTSDVEALFHEFGHALHHVYVPLAAFVHSACLTARRLSHTEFQHMAGTYGRCCSALRRIVLPCRRSPFDFVEVPSHVMERFATDFDFLRCVHSFIFVTRIIVSLWATHVHTGQPISRSTVSRLAKSQRLFFADHALTLTFHVRVVFAPAIVECSRTGPVRFAIAFQFYSFPREFIAIAGTAPSADVGQLHFALFAITVGLAALSTCARFHVARSIWPFNQLRGFLFLLRLLQSCRVRNLEALFPTRSAECAERTQVAR